jgi:hypothetical protein
MSEYGKAEREFEHAVRIEHQPLGMSRSDILLMLKRSHDFAMTFFFGDSTDMQSGDFQRDDWPLLIDPQYEYVADAWPRGHAKTANTKCAVLINFLFNDYRFCAYTSSTHAIAANDVKDIVDALESPNAVSVFGEPAFEIKRDSNGIYVMTINAVSSEMQFYRKTVVLKAFGVCSQIRGTVIKNLRPDLLIFDDIEDDSAVETPGQQRKIMNWVYGPAMKACAKHSKKIMLGNMLSNASVLYHCVCDSPRWYSRRYGCLKPDLTPLWPERWTLEALLDDFREYQAQGLTGRWFAEMMNIVMPIGGGLIGVDEIDYLPPLMPEEVEAACITVDPAISQKEWADKCGITVHALAYGRWRSVEYVCDRLSQDQIYFVCVRLCQKWGTRTVGIESAGYQMVLRTLFELFAEKYKQKLNVVMVPHHNRSKTERIGAWCSLLRTHEYALTRGDYAVVEQLLNYDISKKQNVDDLIDSHAMFPTMLQYFMPQVMEKYTLEPERLLRSAETYCDICSV